MEVTSRQSKGWMLCEPVEPRQGKRVLLIPGLQGSDLVFHPLMAEPALAEAGVHLIGGNPPGFKGQPVPEGFDFRIESFAALVEAVCEAERVDLVVGHSFGANVLLEVAARQHFNGPLVLISPALERKAESKDLLMLDAMSRKPLLAGAMWWLTYLMMESAFKPYFSDKAILAQVTAEGKRIPRAIGRQVLLRYFDFLDQHGDLAPRLCQTKVPVHVVRGLQDEIAFSDAHRAALAACERITLHEVPDARHFAMVDQPAAIARIIVQALGA